VKTKIIALFLLFTCISVFNQELYQVSSYQALYSGKLDGIVSMSDILKHGNTGIGGFNALNGEMVLINGKIYQVLASGKIVVHPDLSDKAPFAAVTNFVPQRKITITNDSNVYHTIDTFINNPDVFVAIKITGEFGYIKTRSVPMQHKPYPPLSEIVKTQPVFEGKNIKGTIVGFRFPSFAAGINPPGYHIHFISDDISLGGHVLEVVPKNVTCEIMIIKEVVWKLPE
jgi:acetolactate decarboxylase